ncbi:MAG: PAS domain S-box protein, partial [Proteobacteria bacterium]
MNKPTKIKVLFIEDSEADMEELLHSLKHGGFEVESSRVEDLESLRLELDRQDWDVVLSDHYLLGFDSFDALALVKAHKSDVPFIVVSGVVEEETAVRAMKLGACDFLKKDRLSRLPSAVSREIAERAARALYRSTQAELKDSEDRFRLMIDAVKDYAIFMLDTDGRFITWNIGSERMFGYSESEAVGAHLSLLYTGSEVGSTHANQALVMTREFGHYEEEGLRRRKDGREFWVHAVMSPVYGPDGTLRGYSRITRDIDELMRGAEALAQAKFNAEEEALARRKLELEREEVEIERGNLKNLFEQTTAILAILAGPEHVFEFANPAYVSLLGENYLGRSFADVQPDLKMLLPLLDKVYLDGETIHQSEVEVTGNDHTRFFDYIFSTKKDGDGKIVGIMMLGSDVTEQRQRRAEAEASSASKSSFLANMSHEIRTPLAAILGFSELLKDMHLVNDERDRYIDTINRNSQALTQIIDDILDMAKIEAGRLDIEGIKFNLSDLLEDVVQLFREKALRKGITLSLKHSPKVPVHVLSDPTRLRQILFNIVG